MLKNWKKSGVGAAINAAVGAVADAATTTVGTTASLVSYVKGILNQLVTVLAKTNLILPGTKIVTKTSTSTLTTGTLFTIAGSVEILSIIGRVTTVIQGQATTVVLYLTVDALTQVALCTSKDINAFAVGSVVYITGTFADAMIGATGVAVVIGQAGSIRASCVTSGVLGVTFGAASTGAIVWEVLWMPLNAAGSIVAA